MDGSLLAQVNAQASHPCEILALLASAMRDGTVGAAYLFFTNIQPLASTLQGEAASAVFEIFRAKMNCFSKYFGDVFCQKYELYTLFNSDRPMVSSWRPSEDLALMLSKGQLVEFTSTGEITEVTWSLHTAILAQENSIRQHIGLTRSMHQLDVKALLVVQSIGSKLLESLGFFEGTEIDPADGVTWFQYYQELMQFQDSAPEAFKGKGLESDLIKLFTAALEEGQRNLAIHLLQAPDDTKRLVFLQSSSKALVALRHAFSEQRMYISILNAQKIIYGPLANCTYAMSTPAPTATSTPAKLPAAAAPPSTASRRKSAKKTKTSLTDKFNAELELMTDQAKRTHLKRIGLGGVYEETDDTLTRLYLSRSSLVLRRYHKNQLAPLLANPDKSEYCWPVICDPTPWAEARCTAKHRKGCAGHKVTSAFRDAIKGIKAPFCDTQDIP